MILIFHGVDNTGAIRHMKTRKFENLLKFLTKHFTIVPLKENGRDNISITFDDGYYNNLTEVLPLLKKYNIPATIFVLGASVNGPGYRIPGENDWLLDWDSLRSLSRCSLIEIGIHGYNHAYNGLIYQAKGIVEKCIGKKVNAYAFPYGLHDHWMINELKSMGFERIYCVDNPLPGVTGRICIANNAFLWIIKSMIWFEMKFPGSGRFFKFSIRKTVRNLWKLFDWKKNIYRPYMNW